MIRYTLGAYKHSATVIKGIQDSSIAPGLQQLLTGGSGAVDASMISIGQIDTRISFTSTMVGTALHNLIGIDGAAISSDVLYFQKMADDGLRAGATSHISATIANGLILPVSIQANQGGQATISLLAIPRSSDGTTSPIVMVANASLEANQDITTEAYTLGAVTLNGTELEGVSSWRFDFGIVPDITFGSGHVYPTMLGVMSRNPSFTIQTFDIAKFQAWTETGLAQTSTDSTVVLQDQEAGGVRGSLPITFTIDEGMAFFENVGGSHGAKAAGTVRIVPVSDGLVDVVVIDVSQPT